MKKDNKLKLEIMAHALYVKGQYLIDGKDGTIAQLEGRFSFINQIEKYNNVQNGFNQKKFYKLNAKEKEMQKFLFYKYFYSNSKPIIVTEDKTDVIYLKAALKNLYKEYPRLIEKDSKGKFNFKISFFRRSNRIRFFFNMSQDGADAMKYLYCFFSENENANFPNYFAYFKSKCVHAYLL